jgi:hypothetical protein
MAGNPLAALGTPVTSALQRKEGPRTPDVSKYAELLKAIKDANFPEGNTDLETQLGWDNIEGEIMAHVLVQSCISGTGFIQIHHPIFKYATVQDCIDKAFVKKTVEQLKKFPYLMAAPSTMMENLNRLMISFNRQGRGELVQMLNAFSISMQEQERNDPMSRAMKGARL